MTATSFLMADSNLYECQPPLHFVPLSSHEVEWHEVERWLYILMDRQPPLFSWLYIRMDRQPPLFSQTATTMDDSHLFFHSGNHSSSGCHLYHFV
jgi:hypothetical protein